MAARWLYYKPIRLVYQYRPGAEGGFTYGYDYLRVREVGRDWVTVARTWAGEGILPVHFFGCFWTRKLVSSFRLSFVSRTLDRTELRILQEFFSPSQSWISCLKLRLLLKGNRESCLFSPLSWKRPEGFAVFLHHSFISKGKFNYFPVNITYIPCEIP